MNTRVIQPAALLALGLLVAGCSTLPRTGPDTVAPLRTYEAIVKDPEADPLNVPEIFDSPMRAR